jgi:hypothetical protein
VPGEHVVAAGPDPLQSHADPGPGDDLKIITMLLRQLWAKKSQFFSQLLLRLTVLKCVTIFTKPLMAKKIITTEVQQRCFKALPNQNVVKMF